MLMSFTITISSCVSPGKGMTCCVGSSRMPEVSSAYISATRCGVSCKPGRAGSSPMPWRISRTPCAIRSRSTISVLFLAHFCQCKSRSFLNHFQRDVRFQSRFAALLKLRHLVYDATIEVRYFNKYRSILRFHLHHTSLQRTPVDLIAPYTERCRFHK